MVVIVTPEGNWTVERHRWTWEGKIEIKP